MNDKFVICVNNESFEIHLTLFRVYRVIPSKIGDKLGLIRLVDDSGEDYAYPAPMFLPIEVPAKVHEIYVAELAWNAPRGVPELRARVDGKLVRQQAVIPLGTTT